ncbi:MAG: nucleotide exchange factor GrpE [Lachnospiraceae bacterium]|nr:nucleotide exchange factor GrpE [Lachnospiraceae bacterium]
MADEKDLKQKAEELNGTDTAAEELEESIEEARADSAEAEAAEEETTESPEEAEGEEPEEDAGEQDTAESEKPAKPDKKDKQIEELNDKYRRLFAEFDNYRKRTEVEKTGMFGEGEKTVLLKVLPLIDNFERALQNVPEEEKDSAFVDGIEKIYRSFLDLMKGLGVEPIEAVGKEFDANLHNAVMHVEDEEAGENTVVEEFQKGYMFRDKVLRYSMVKVAN